MVYRQHEGALPEAIRAAPARTLLEHGFVDGSFHPRVHVLEASIYESMF